MSNVLFVLEILLNGKRRILVYNCVKYDMVGLISKSVVLLVSVGHSLNIKSDES